MFKRTMSTMASGQEANSPVQARTSMEMATNMLAASKIALSTERVSLRKRLLERLTMALGTKIRSGGRERGQRIMETGMSGDGGMARGRAKERGHTPTAKSM